MGRGQAQAQDVFSQIVGERRGTARRYDALVADEPQGTQEVDQLLAQIKAGKLKNALALLNSEGGRVDKSESLKLLVDALIEEVLAGEPYFEEKAINYTASFFETRRRYGGKTIPVSKEVVLVWRKKERSLLRANIRSCLRKQQPLSLEYMRDRAQRAIRLGFVEAVATQCHRLGLKQLTRLGDLRSEKGWPPKGVYDSFWGYNDWYALVRDEHVNRVIGKEPYLQRSTDPIREQMAQRSRFRVRVRKAARAAKERGYPLKQR
jgi:hypothetical protein